MQVTGVVAEELMLHDNTELPPEVIAVGETAKVRLGATAVGVVEPPELPVLPLLAWLLPLEAVGLDWVVVEVS